MKQLLQNIWTILTLDCEGSAELTSESFDRRLNWAEHLAVWFHCLICRKSRKLNRQLRSLNSKLTSVLSADKPQLPVALSADAKSRIARKLEQALGDNS